MTDKYAKQDLDSEISVNLTLRDLIIQSWGHGRPSRHTPLSNEKTLHPQARQPGLSQLKSAYFASAKSKE
ncbi:hypothetical protein [Pseudomonas caricapapayae]|nr:hypothetical protein [Pseudomonas caricapapayae]RMV97416.1 hypothetical protein ALP01_200360 [Pseudomonas caricapapayae]